MALLQFDETDDLIDICMDNVFKAVFESSGIERYDDVHVFTIPRRTEKKEVLHQGEGKKGD
jgi:hypothetical protein